MQKTLPAIFLVSAVLLAACASKGPQTLMYSLTFDAYGQAHRMELISAAERVLNRRIAATGVKGTAIVVPLGGTSATATVKMPDPDTAKTIRTQLSNPFIFDIRVEEQPSANPEKEPLTNWKKTDIVGADLQWIQVIADKNSGKIGAELQFTPAGRQKLDKVFSALAAANAQAKTAPGGSGKPPRAIGIFVRDFLVSKLVPPTEHIQDRIIISGIPSATVAQVFADDVNVGLHVHFVPKP